MEIGIFLMPAHPPERTLYDATRWDLDVIELADQLGYVEAWVGEHFTVPWEPICAPDLLLAQALLRTQQIKLAPGAHLLPYHHPVELAHRVAYFDHLAQGRFMLGVGASGIPGDWALYDVDGKNGEHREMTREALEIMLRIWTEDEPWECYICDSGVFGPLRIAFDHNELGREPSCSLSHGAVRMRSSELRLGFSLVC